MSSFKHVSWLGFPVSEGSWVDIRHFGKTIWVTWILLGALQVLYV